MTEPFAVRTTPHFERLTRGLIRRHPEFLRFHEQAVEILTADPYNRTRQHHIAKLTAVPQGDGQYRLRLRRFRFRYDIYDRDVVLQACSLRREDSYP